MNFHSLSFGIFLVTTFCLFWLVYRRRNLRTALLVVASYFFYGSWQVWYLGLLVFSTLLDYTCGRIIADSEDPRRRKAALLVSLIGNLGILSFYKFHDFGIESLRYMGDVLGFEVPTDWVAVVMPVGISFYTFQTLSYTIDIYRRRIAPARDLLDFSLFVTFFPQLVAGPIVRASEFLPQLELSPRFDRARLHDGIYRIVQGLGKKVLLADMIGRFLVDPVHANPGDYSVGMHLLALYAFPLQLYLDFSGYSDCALGTARLFGFDLPENFDLPFRARSVREFWRRWHMTLSFWIRDYMYFPLGGSRRGEGRTAFNLVFVMLIIGLWHGATLLWICYGLLQGSAMVMERWLERRRGGLPFTTTPARSFAAWLYAFHFQVVTMICIRGEDVGSALAVFTEYGSRFELPTWGLVALGFAFFSHFVPGEPFARLYRRTLAAPTFAVGLGAGLLLGLIAFASVSETPFIYFQF